MEYIAFGLGQDCNTTTTVCRFIFASAVHCRQLSTIQYTVKSVYSVVVVG